MAEVCRLNEDTVWDCIKRLEGLGLIQRTKGRRNSNQYVLLMPISVTGNGGVIHHANPPRKTDATQRKAGDEQSPEKEGRKGIQWKGNKEVCGASPPDSHTISLWISEAQASHPKIDCEAVWKIYSAAKPGHENKGVFLRWCANEKNLIRKAPRPKPIEEGPEGWREALEKMHPENLVNAEQRPWSAVPGSKQAEVHEALRSA